MKGRSGGTGIPVSSVKAERVRISAKLSSILQQPKQRCSDAVIKEITEDPRVTAALRNFIALTEEQAAHNENHRVYCQTPGNFIYGNLAKWDEKRNGWWGPTSWDSGNLKVARTISLHRRRGDDWMVNLGYLDMVGNGKTVEVAVELNGAGLCFDAEIPADLGFAMGVQFLRWLRDTEGKILPVVD